MTKEMDDERKLFDRIRNCLEKAQSIHTSAFRSAGVRYANEGDIVSGEGASYYGGRWNPVGIKAIYMSLDPLTAVHECYAEFIRYGFSAGVIKPRVIAGVSIRIDRVLNLTEKSIPRLLGITLEKILSEDWQAIQSNEKKSRSQMVGKGARNAGFEGLLVSSARHREGKNLVVFPENLLRSSKLSPMEERDLPPHPRNWPAGADWT